MAAALGAVATERQPHRSGRPDVRWVVADGLLPFRRVDAAIIAGMGWRTITRILAAVPSPPVAVLHAQDDPPALRTWLAGNGFRIEEERLAREARRFAEVLRVVPGREQATGLELFFGPRLLHSDDPLLEAHLTQLHGYYAALATRTRAKKEVHAKMIARRDFLARALSSR